MNKETENEKLASTIVKVNDIDKRLGELEQLYGNPKVFVDTWVGPAVRCEIEATTQIEKQGARIDNFLREIREREKFIEDTKFNIFFAITSSVLVGSILAFTSFLVMAIGGDNRLGYRIALAVPIGLFIVSGFFLYKFMPESIKIWWRQSRIGRTINGFVRFVRRIWRIIKRA